MAEDAAPVSASKLSARQFLRAKSRDETKAAYFGKMRKMRSPERLPRVIHMFWDSGFDTAPEIVQLCKKSWEINNPGWILNLLDAEAARAVLDPDSFPSRPSIQAYSDLLRLRILDRFGGVWADATALSLRPLDDWLPWIFAETGFFAFHRPGADRVLSTWLLAAVPGDPLIHSWRERAEAFWAEPLDEEPPYFWAHYLFEHLIHNSPQHRQIWNKVPRFNAGSVHQLVFHFLGGREAARVLPILRQAPVQKLTHKEPIDLERLAALLGEVRPELAARLFAR